MPGTRTAPDVTTAPTNISLSTSWIDADEGETTDSNLVLSTATPLQMETFLDASQAGSNASLWKVKLISEWSGEKNKSYALSDDVVSVHDLIRLSLKSGATKAYEQYYMPAPLGELVNNKIVDTTNALYTDWRNAVLPLMLTGYVLLNTGFVQRRVRSSGTSP